MIKNVPPQGNDLKGIELNSTLIQEEYAQRRHTLMSTLGAGSMAVVASAPTLLRNGDAHYPYRQHSDFYYLTGFKESDAVAVLLYDGAEVTFILFNRAQEASQTLWTGPVVGQAGACDEYGAHEAYPIDDFPQYFLPLLKKCHTLHSIINHNPHWAEQLQQILKAANTHDGVSIRHQFMDLSGILHEQRLIKSASEIHLMSQAADMSAKAHQLLMEQCAPGKGEYVIEGYLLQYFYQQGCRHTAYESIIAGGENACVLHYVKNDSVLKNGDLLLVDAGVEYQYYASDVSRTFPVNGKFSSQQKDLYTVVLQAQLAGIAAVKPGASWGSIQEAIVDVITEGLLDLGLLQGNKSVLIEEKAYKVFYPHSSGHWLGLDVHDVGDYKVNNQWRSLQEGMVLTVEPGIYIAADNDNVPHHWRGIGIRIEDDVLVTAENHRVLSAAVPKTVDDIETCMAS